MAFLHPEAAIPDGAQRAWCQEIRDGQCRPLLGQRQRRYCSLAQPIRWTNGMRPEPPQPRLRLPAGCLVLVPACRRPQAQQPIEFVHMLHAHRIGTTQQAHHLMLRGERHRHCAAAAFPPCHHESVLGQTRLITPSWVTATKQPAGAALSCQRMQDFPLCQVGVGICVMPIQARRIDNADYRHCALTCTEIAGK
jgi:hypothetical protein